MAFLPTSELTGDNDLDNLVPWGHHGVNIYDRSHPEETIGANHDISRVTIHIYQASMAPSVAER